MTKSIHNLRGSHLISEKSTGNPCKHSIANKDTLYKFPVTERTTLTRMKNSITSLCHCDKQKAYNVLNSLQKCKSEKYIQNSMRFYENIRCIDVHLYTGASKKNISHLSFQIQPTKPRNSIDLTKDLLNIKRSFINLSTNLHSKKDSKVSSQHSGNDSNLIKKFPSHNERQQKVNHNLKHKYENLIKRE